jgi:hypothetical protein
MSPRGMRLHRVLAAIASVALLGCPSEPGRGAEAISTPESERDAPLSLAGEWRLPGGERVMLRAGRLELQGVNGRAIWSGQVVGLPAFDGAGRRVVYSELAGGERGTRLVARERGPAGWSAARELAGGPGNPDRPAVTPDGERVVFFSGKTGVPSLHVVPFAGGEPVQVTNRGLRRGRARGKPPAGFIEPPHEGAPWFERGRVVWDAPSGRKEQVLP